MQHLRVSKKSEGQPTRGKTATNRLRRVDNFILLYEPALLSRIDGLFADSLFVDLGYGFDPRTTLESAARFRRVNPDLPILGVELDRERVEAARPSADDKTFFRLGGFNLPLKEGEHVRLIRAFNVLRQYEEKDFAPAHERLPQYVLPGGLMIEGTSDRFGSMWCANVVRKIEGFDAVLSKIGDWRIRDREISEWRLDALVFSTNFRLGFEVEEFQTILPKNSIHHVVKGEQIHDFFEVWKQSAAETSPMRIYGARQWFVAAAKRLAERGYPFISQRKWLARRYLIWKLGESWEQILPEKRSSHAG